ncbi:hypothetical protein [Gracilimonas sediminicola]|uniref:Uncharacterized protein n=1 Tax=Gracilimonas sediminicola TaxID=2952158 RepID=A0A9X2L587_9BACT|nr:hypothetical protein [Gracilimonas sediminicola]MCP9292598.1 hypothetical protein [Gracilimonas sediminicola]
MPASLSLDLLRIYSVLQTTYLCGEKSIIYPLFVCTFNNKSEDGVIFMKNYVLVLMAVCYSVSIQAQVKMDSLVVGVNPDFVQTNTVNYFNGDGPDNFKNSLETDVNVYLSKKFLIWRRSLQGAFKNEKEGVSSELPIGDTREIVNFELDDNLIIEMPFEAFFENGEYVGVKIVFGHAIEAEKTAIIFKNDETVQIVFTIIGIDESHNFHIQGHICNPLDTECD